VLFQDARWHCVEAIFQLNSVDVRAGIWKADGGLRGWVDGKQVIERRDGLYRTVDFPNMKFHQLLLTPYFGEGLLPHAQTLWIDELVAGIRRIGPLKKR